MSSSTGAPSSETLVGAPGVIHRFLGTMRVASVNSANDEPIPDRKFSTIVFTTHDLNGTIRRYYNTNGRIQFLSDEPGAALIHTLDGIKFLHTERSGTHYFMPLVSEDTRDTAAILFERLADIPEMRIY